METENEVLIVPRDSMDQEPTPVPLQLHQLEAKLKDILEDSVTPPDTKLRLYSHVLHQVGSILEDMKKPKQVEIKKVKASLACPSAHELTKGVPAQKHETAAQLASFLEKTDAIKWNSNSELLVNGVPIRGSHIFDLFDWMVRDRVTEANKPKGFDKFFEKLQDANVPLTAIGNKYLKITMQRGTGRQQMKHVTRKKKPLRFHWQNFYK